jgi:hypothetical protein
MANYAITDYRTKIGAVADVLNEMETYLETKDSTTNPIYLIQIVQHGGSLVEGVILHG